MRSIFSSLAFFSVLTLQAAPHQQGIESVKQFAATHFDRLSCTQVAASGNSKTVTIELNGVPKRGAAATLDAATLLRDVFATSSGTEFRWDHASTLKGRSLAVYNFGYQVNGKTRAGSIFADEKTGAISRITIRGAEAPAHLFCSSQSR
jgi:hypothetical protein